jgi:hypothetical protein
MPLASNITAAAMHTTPFRVPLAVGSIMNAQDYTPMINGRVVTFTFCLPI